MSLSLISKQFFIKLLQTEQVSAVQSLYNTYVWVHMFIGTILQRNYLRNEFNFWNVHGLMNTSGLLHLE